MIGVFTCLCELAHLTGAVIGQAGQRGEGGVPVLLSVFTHVSDEGGQERVGEGQSSMHYINKVVEILSALRESRETL